MWQRPHHIALRLVAEGHRVIYFNGPIFLSFSIFKYRKEGNIFITKKVSKNLAVASIFITPSLGKSRFFAKKLGLLSCKIPFKSLNFEPNIAIFCSLHYDFLLEPLKSTGVKIVYDCIDDFSAFSGVSDVTATLESERYMTEQSSLVIAASKTLCERLSKINSSCFYIPNGADFEHFNTATRIKKVPDEIAGLRHPIIGYIGAVFDWVNIELICRLAEVHPDYSILLVGPVNFGLNKLRKYSNIVMVGTKQYNVLPQYLACMDVCLIPFMINKLTLSSNPIKLYEYLAAGKPVVSTALPEIRNNASDIVYIGESDGDFIKKVEEAVKEVKRNESEVEKSRRISFAKDNSWDRRVETIEKLFEEI